MNLSTLRPLTLSHSLALQSTFAVILSVIKHLFQPRVTSAAWTICFNRLHETRVHCTTSFLRHKCWIRHHSDKLLSAAITERSFSDTPGHINTVRSTCLLSHHHSGLTQEEDEGNNPHKQYKLAGFVPAASMLALQRDLITSESSLMFHGKAGQL